VREIEKNSGGVRDVALKLDLSKKIDFRELRSRSEKQLKVSLE
jgi:hypothetical protein